MVVKNVTVLRKGSKLSPDLIRRMKQIIKAEWESDAGKSGRLQFIERLRDKLTATGIVGEEGKPLTENQISWRMWESGIRFRGHVSTRKRKKITPRIVTTMKIAMPRTSKIPPVLDAILRDDGLNSKQRLDLVGAYFGV